MEHIDYLSNPDLKMFKTTVESELGSSPNFAGTYIIATNGCGTMCQVNHILNVKTGVVIDSISSNLGVCFSSKSRLLIVNPYLSESYPDDIPEWAYVYYYLVKGDKVSLLEKSKINYKGSCESYW